MADEKETNLSNEGSAEERSSAPFGVEPYSSPMEGRTRRGRSIATLDVHEGPFAEVSVDTFAVPSETPVERNEDPERKLTGSEPAIFGGASPDSPTSAVVDPNAPPPEEGPDAERIGGDLDELVRTGDLLADVPQIDYLRILRSTPFLLSAMLACLIAATFLVNLIVPTETYARTAVLFHNFARLNDQERADLETEINTTLRSLPLRRLAYDILQGQTKSDKDKVNPAELKAGFLDSGLTFHRLNAISWPDDGHVVAKGEEEVMWIRVDSANSDELATDVLRLQAVRAAFYQLMDDRNHKKDDLGEELKKLQQDQADLVQEDAKLRKQVANLSEQAQRYVDLKASMQSMERYIEVQDESNPMRLVARQQLAQLTQQVAEARRLSLQRDELIARRVTVQKKAEDTKDAIDKKVRQIEVFAWPEKPDPKDPKTIEQHDTTDQRTKVQRVTWISIIVMFAGIIFLIHLHDQRVAEAARRERREKLKAQQRQQEPEQQES